MEEIFSVMEDISKEKFNLIKESDKLKLDISFPILKKEKHLLINLKEVIETSSDIIKRLKKKAKIKKIE